MEFPRVITGQDGYLFLYNDSNHEILQHFRFASTAFSDMLSFKNDFFQSRHIVYKCFIIPDKSVICQSLLPNWIDTTNMYRFVDSLPQISHFSSLLSPEHYCRFDSHMNFKGGFEYVKAVIQHLYPDEHSIFDALLEQEILWTRVPQWDTVPDFLPIGGDLISTLNIGPVSVKTQHLISSFAKNQFVDLSSLKNPASVRNLTKTIPLQFKFVYGRTSEWYENLIFPSGHFFQKALFLCDSHTFHILQFFFNFCFAQTFYYWDHGYFNSELIDWFQPDIVIDCRTERFISKWKWLPDPYRLPIILSRDLIPWTQFQHDYLPKVLYFHHYIRDMDEIRENIPFWTCLIKHHFPTYAPVVDPLPSDFHWKRYTELNEDLAHMDEIEASAHYLYNGKSEHRIYV